MRTLLTQLPILALLLVPSAALHAASGDTVTVVSGTGSIVIDQAGPPEEPDLVGLWTMIRPGNQRVVSDQKTFSFGQTAAGNYTFTTEVPAGASAAITFSVDGVVVENLLRPQISFTLQNEQSAHIEVAYTFTRTGVVSVTSTPKGLSFTVKGPNESEYKGTTPASFEGVPEGLYTVYFDTIEGCITPRPQSARLIKDSRINLDIEVACDALDDLPQVQEEQKNLEFVKVMIDGEEVVFTDVKTTDWFSTFVHQTAKTGIITGYTDTLGRPTGLFGPGDNVTIAQLAKIAHEIADIDQTKVRVPVENERALGQWFELYIASAEQQWWEVFRDRRVDPSRSATRAEVIVTLLRALEVPRVWAKGKTFGDVLPSIPYADAIETAAWDGLVDAGGNFRPGDPVNRAETSKIVAKAMELYLEDTSEIRSDYDN